MWSAPEILVGLRCPGFGRAASLASVVDLSSVTHRDHGHDKQSVVDRVDDAVVADPNSPSGSAM